MNYIYLVCTRSAISASALTYIINQSPQFYNTTHHNLYIDENGTFNKAVTINDWWNISYDYDKIYNKDVRNNETMSLDTLRTLCDNWNIDKDIALFTHATNTKDIMKWRDEFNLPVKVITTVMGKNCFNYLDMYLKREYSSIMNKFTDLFDTWKHVYTQFLSIDTMWSTNADYVLEMHDWLDNPKIVYDKLDICNNTHIAQWVKEYKMFNSYTELDINKNNVSNKLKTICYIYHKYEYMLHNDMAKRLFAIAIFECVNEWKENNTMQDMINNVANKARLNLTNK
tara:strand:- start:2450 stop:3301 length:852 start_codon:yes stop_codon:yes gene_type:complete